MGQPKPFLSRKASILLGIVAVVIAGVGAAWLLGVFGGHRGTLVLAGTVEIQEVRLGSKIGGRIKSVSVREGERVQTYQELVRFETPDWTRSGTSFGRSCKPRKPTC